MPSALCGWRAAGGWDLVKLEVLSDARTLYPDMEETLRALKLLVAEGFAADLFVFDPATVASEPARLVHDLPGGTPRLFAGSHGVVRVLVNGVETVRNGAPTGAVPGTLLRSGRDTASVVPAGV